MTKKENEQPTPQSEPADAQPFSSEPRMTSQLTIAARSDISELSQPQATSHPPTTATDRKNELPPPQPKPAEAQPFSSQPQMTSQLTIEDSDEDSDLSDLDSDPSQASPPHVISYESASISTPTGDVPAAARTARTRTAPHLKPTPKLKTKDSGSSLSDTYSTTTTSNNDHSPPKPGPADAQSVSTKTEMATGQEDFWDSFTKDDNSSGSDSDLPDLFTPPTTSQKPRRSTRKLRDAGSTTKSRAQSYASPLTFQPKHKYKFSITSLVSQSQRHEATEASAQRAKTILDEPGNGEEAGQQDDKEALLESVIADKDTDSANKILQAVARTEATSTEKRWYFFDPDSKVPTHKPTNTPANISKIYQKWNQGGVIDRDSTAVSGAMSNAARTQEELSEKEFLWILEMSCTQPATNLEESYFDALLAAPGAIDKYLRPKAVKKIFDLLGALRQATDRKANVEAVGVYKKAYRGRNLDTLQRYIKFLGDAAKSATPVTCAYTTSLLARLCADNLVKENNMILSIVRYAMGELCDAIEKHGAWEISCHQICSNIYKTVAQEPICLHILECIPGSTPHLIDLRARLSLSVFCRDCDLTQKPAKETVELRKLMQVLSGPRFQINRETDYVQLAALISLLDIAIDDGSGADLDVSDPQAEEEYNSCLDELAYLLKVIWSSINDRGTLSPSRIHTKRTVEKLRNRLLEMVRTRLKPRQSIFDLSGQGAEREGALKQSAFMTKHFRKPITNE
ncbi:hypothetical protein GMDG_07012 [Pseudogymnoascus destructans 20631-21]|uniref:Uncharacterized protein n=2 Tax=Pseudogymnoascus destructans TaxID=655981 RepID=L8FUZ7_PSED2|nr:hypothetical protein GMDG_07012 [Pseudogymnoascus destructans 20631-21]